MRFNENSRRPRGNPNWGKPFIDIPKVPTQFERKVEELRLDGNDNVVLASSPELREWARRNAIHRFIPEALLAEWNICADEDRF